MLYLILLIMLWAAPGQAITLVSEDFEGTAGEIAARWPGQSYCKKW
jgi:hypothetical protein